MKMILFKINWYKTLLFYIKSKKLNLIFIGRCNISLMKNAQIVHKGNIRSYIGKMIGPTGTNNDITIINLKESSRIDIGENSSIGSGCKINIEESASLIIGSNTYLSSGTIIGSSLQVKIGNKCSLSWNLTIIDDDGHNYSQNQKSCPISIGNNVWIGCNVTILKGVEIKDNTVVAAGSVVTKSFPADSFIGGVPAKLLSHHAK